jgi:hypothetical protein
MNTKENKTQAFYKEAEDLRRRIIAEIRRMILSQGTERLSLEAEDLDDIFVIVYNWAGEPLECRVTSVSTDPQIEDSLKVHSVDMYSLCEMTSKAPYELGATNIYWLIEILERINTIYHDTH